MGCLLTMIRPSGWTRRRAAIDPAGSGGGGQRGGGPDAVHPGGALGGDGAGPRSGQGAAGDGVHEVPVQAHGYPGAGVAGADLVLLAVDGDVPVALDLAVDLDRLPGGQRRLAPGGVEDWHRWTRSDLASHLT